MKHISAIATAFLITAVIGFGIMVIGVNAFTNKNTVPLQNSPSASLSRNSLSTNSNNSAGSPGSSSADVQQLQLEVNSLQSQLDQANQVILQYQSLVAILQQRGVISIDQNGNIYLPEGETTNFH